MFSQRVVVRFIVGALLVLGLAACAPAPLHVRPGQATSPASAAASAKSEDASHTPALMPVAGSIRLTDAAGREITLDELPQRIVVVGRASHMVLHALHLFPQGRDRLVAFDKKTMTSMEFLQLVDPAYDSRTIMEGTPGVEQIAALQPDLVLMKSPAAQDITNGLTALGIPVVYLGLETPALFEQDIANLGVLLGAPERAREIAAFYRSRLDMVGQALLDVTEAERSRVLLCQYSSKGGEVAVSVPAEAWMQTILVEKAGGVPVWLENAEPTNGWKTINLEQIVLWDPDQIVIVAYGAIPRRSSPSCGPTRCGAPFTRCGTIIFTSSPPIISAGTWATRAGFSDWSGWPRGSIPITCPVWIWPTRPTSSSASSMASLPPPWMPRSCPGCTSTSIP